MTVLDDLADVMAAGEPREWSEVLCERLAAHRPDVYTGWQPSDLAAAVAPFGITTEQIGRRVDGTFLNRRGIDRARVHAALTERDRRRDEPTGT